MAKILYPPGLTEIPPACAAIVEKFTPIIQRVGLLREAHHSFYDVPKLTGSPNYTHSESIYYKLYEDIRDNPDIWFDGVFPQKSLFAEWAVGILGTLATMRRQRGQVQDCLDILKVDARVLKVYQEMVKQINTQDETDCCLLLTYKYNLIGINAHSQDGNKKAAVQAFRDAVTFEIQHADHPNRDHIIHWIWLLRPFCDDPENVTLDELDKITDNQIWPQLKLYTDPPGEGALDCKLRVCDYCAKEEDMLGDHKCCGACQEAWYCSKKCQRKHWKDGHKQECGKEDRCTIKNLKEEDLKEVAQLLIENYSKTVQVHSKNVVTEQQKKSLVPELMNLFLDTIKRRPELNSAAAFQDLGRDKDFNAELDAFFEKQDGFESLVYIHKTPQAIACKEKHCSAKKTVRVEDDTLLRIAKEMVRHFAGSCGDVDESHFDLLTATYMMELKTVLLEYPEYNSYQGLEKLFEDTDVKLRLIWKLAEVMVKENPDAWLEEEPAPQK